MKEFISIPTTETDSDNELIIPIDNIVLEKAMMSGKKVFKILLNQRDSRLISEKVYNDIKNKLLKVDVLVKKSKDDYTPELDRHDSVDIKIPFSGSKTRKKRSN